MLEGDSEGHGNGEYVHPLDRDYTVTAPKSKWWRLKFKNKGFVVGAVGFAIGGMFLIAGIIASQWLAQTGFTDALATGLHRIGSYCILAAGVCVVVTKRREIYGNKYVRIVVVRRNGQSRLSVEEWASLVESNEDLFVSETPVTSEASGLEASGLNSVYLVVMGNPLAQFNYAGQRFGLVDVCYLKKNERKVLQWLNPRVKAMKARLISTQMADRIGRPLAL